MLLCQLRDINIMSRESLGTKQAQLITMVLVVCYVVWIGSMKGKGHKTCARRASLVHCCGLGSYRAQVPQHSIETYIKKYM